MKKKKIYFSDGVIDVHYIDINNIHEDNEKCYETVLYEAIDYIEHNDIVEAYLPGEYISLRKSNVSEYSKDIKYISSVIKSMILEIEKYS